MRRWYATKYVCARNTTHFTIDKICWIYMPLRLLLLLLLMYTKLDTFLPIQTFAYSFFHSSNTRSDWAKWIFLCGKLNTYLWFYQNVLLNVCGTIFCPFTVQFDWRLHHEWPRPFLSICKWIFQTRSVLRLACATCHMFMIGIAIYVRAIVVNRFSIPCTYNKFL